MTIAVAVVNHNTCDHLDACLHSVMSERPLHVVVVDNASKDGSPEMVAAKYPDVQLVTARNEGFGAGANLAIRTADAPYVLLLNSDTLLHPGTLFPLKNYLEAHPEVGIVGPRLINADGSLQPSAYPTPSPVAELMRWTSLAKITARIPDLRRRYLVQWPHDWPADVGWVVGAALAIRRAAFDQIGGFDTSFFMYSEEVDLAYRMHQRGWQIHFAPVATVTHFGGASTEANRSEMMATLFASMHRFYRKHHSRRLQLQFKVIVTYFMLRNLLRDRWRLRGGRCEATCEQLSQDVAAWRQVLQLTWSGR